MTKLEKLKEKAQKHKTRRLPQQVLNPAHKSDWNERSKFTTIFIPLLSSDEDFDTDVWDKYTYCYGILIRTDVPPYNIYNPANGPGCIMVFRLCDTVITKLIAHFGFENAYRNLCPVTVECLSLNNRDWNVIFHSDISIDYDIKALLRGLVTKYPLTRESVTYVSNTQENLAIKHLDIKSICKSAANEQQISNNLAADNPQPNNKPAVSEENVSETKRTEEELTIFPVQQSTVASIAVVQPTLEAPAETAIQTAIRTDSINLDISSESDLEELKAFIQEINKIRNPLYQENFLREHIKRLGELTKSTHKTINDSRDSQSHKIYTLEDM
ncbi:MAG: hypothetical protein LBN97_07700 [Oscillospiraceae bacterium]|jgi:hypothetical protein|nr:hypothetical protein [Oscillospiraceae bacterium]